MTVAREAWRLLVPALVAGALLGVGGRLVMRLVALSAGGATGFSLGGSLEVVLIGVIIGAPVALVLFLVRRRARLPVPWFGVGLALATLGLLALFPPPAARSALAGTNDPQWLTASLFGFLFALYGLCLDLWWATGGRMAMRQATDC